MLDNIEQIGKGTFVQAEKSRLRVRGFTMDVRLSDKSIDKNVQELSWTGLTSGTHCRSWKVKDIGRIVTKAEGRWASSINFQSIHHDTRHFRRIFNDQRTNVLKVCVFVAFIFLYFSLFLTLNVETD